MDFQSIIPNDGKWKIKDNIVYVRYLAWIPIINFKQDPVQVYFDTRLHRYLLKIIPKIKTEFYLVSPILIDPKNKYLDEEEVHRVNILNMISNYSNPKFFHGFQKIDFELLTHLVKYCKKYDSMLLIKEAYDHVNSEVNVKHNDWYTNRSFYPYSEEIRIEFNGLYRQIKLADLLN